MTPSTTILLVAAALSVSSARAACDDALKPLLGLRLEPVAGYEARLAAGIKREGRAELIPGVGMESLQGRSGEFTVDRIMVFEDNGRFHSIRAVVDAPDDGAGPRPNVVQSARFKELLVGLTTELRLLCSSTSRIERFRFEDGHPGYPVFWDFAFLVRTAKESLILVGSSSD